MVNLDVSLTNLIQDDVSDFTVKNLGSITNEEDTVRAQQLFFKEVLIIVVTIRTPSDHETDNPELDWDRQLDIVESAHDLKNILGMASLIQTRSSQYNNVLINVRMNMPLAKDKAIHYCNLDFGHLYRFGNDENFLFIIDPPEASQEETEWFIFNDLSYILSLTQIIKENHRLFLDYKNELLDIDKQIQKHLTELPLLKHETDTIMLAIHKDHVSELEKKTLEIQTNTQKLLEQLKFNIMQSEKLMQNIKLVKDSIFVEDYEDYNNYKTNVQQWLDTSDEIFNRIFTGVKEYSNQISVLFKKEEPPLTRPLGAPKVYTDTASVSENFSFDKSPYKNIIDQIRPELGSKSGLLETIPLQWCSSYILLEPQPERSLKIFSDLIRDKFLGLCITRKAREELVNQYELKDTPIYQINTEESDYSVPPVLSRISHLINEFLSSNLNSVIYFDGIEYLVQTNDLKRVLKFNNNIKESIILNDSILIISINDSAFNENDLSLFLENSINISNCEVEFEDII